MAFMTHNYADGKVPANEYVAAGAFTPKVGMALVVEDGAAAIATGADKPTHICMTERDEAVEAGTIIPAFRCVTEMVLETEAAAAFTGVSVGDKVQISADGLKVTATTGGAAEVVYIDGTEEGAKIRIRF